jgi:hypothetical protein
MKTRERTFVDQVLAGDVDAEAIDDFVDLWHDGPDDGRSLGEFLGFSGEEYALWVEKPKFLPAILASKRFGFDLEEAARDLAAVPIAARALNQQEADLILDWLRKTKRV